MRMLDPQKNVTAKELQIYLSVKEAKELRNQLDRLLKDPEAFEHCHIYADDGSRQISVSILTDRKMEHSQNYSELERRVFNEP